MKAINGVDKKGNNKFDNYKYARDVEIKQAVREQLIRQKVIFRHDIEEEKISSEAIKGKMNVLVRVKVKYAFIDIESGEREEGSYYGHGSDKGDKGLYKAITGSIKYILTSTFLIPTLDDPENHREHETNSEVLKKKEASDAKFVEGLGIDEKKDLMKCPLCDGTLHEREGKFGKFYGCSNYGKTKCPGKVK